MNPIYRMAKMLPEPIKILLRPIARANYWLLGAGQDLGSHIIEWRFRRRFPLPREVEKRVFHIWRKIPKDAWGGCPSSKARVLASLIIANRLTRTVEIGVYRGSSLFPQAVAQAYVGGIAIGVDPYLSDEAKQSDNRQILGRAEDFFRAIDWDSIYQDVLDTIQTEHLSDYCRILRMTSDQAANTIEPGLDMVHIDGNHDYVKVEGDIQNYVPRLRVGGILVMDDISWNSIAHQYERLKKSMELLYEVRNTREAWGCLVKV